MKVIHGAPSYSLHSDLVSLHITREGGHLAPVTFTLGERKISPYALSPWQPSDIDPALPPLLKNLRGDFLCLPFGPQENAPPHGETANHPWEKISETPHSITLAIQASDISAHITKTISLHPGHTALYISHTIENLEGSWSYGSHPILDLTTLPDLSARLSLSPFRWASVYPQSFSDPADGAHQSLKKAAPFSDLTAVPLATGGTTDLTHYPARPGSDDLVMMVSAPPTPAQPFAWTACTADGYVWFSLKNPIDFPATLFWLSNGGRSAPPWHSRHTARIGLEEVCSHFCDSVETSRKNLLDHLSIPTTRHFSKDTPVTLKLIQAIAPIPENFGLVTAITPDGENHITLTGENGTSIRTPIHWKNL